MQDWRDIYGRELLINPPAEAFLAGYFGYEPPIDTGPVSDDVPDFMTLPENEA